MDYIEDKGASLALTAFWVSLIGPVLSFIFEIADVITQGSFHGFDPALGTSLLIGTMAYIFSFIPSIIALVIAGRAQKISRQDNMSQSSFGTMAMIIAIASLLGITLFGTRSLAIFLSSL